MGLLGIVKQQPNVPGILGVGLVVVAVLFVQSSLACSVTSTGVEGRQHYQEQFENEDSADRLVSAASTSLPVVVSSFLLTASRRPKGRGVQANAIGADEIDKSEDSCEIVERDSRQARVHLETSRTRPQKQHFEHSHRSTSPKLFTFFPADFWLQDDDNNISWHDTDCLASASGSCSCCCCAQKLSSHHCHRCSSSITAPREESLTWKMLSWIRRIVLKLVQSYHALPIVMILLPLFTGFVVGYIIGRQQQRSLTRTTRADNSKLPTQSSRLIPHYSPRLLGIVHLAISVMAGILQSCFSYYLSRAKRLWWQSYQWPPQANDPSMTKNEQLASSTVSSASLLMAPGGTQVFPQTVQALKQREDETRRSLSTKSKQLGLVSMESQPRATNAMAVSSTDPCVSSRNLGEGTSGIPPEDRPKHIAVIMDGNRRYGRAVYGGNTRSRDTTTSVAAGHWDGSRKLLELVQWCLAESIPILTVYAFSTENWRRDPAEVSALMELFARYCEELRTQALQHRIRVYILSTETAMIPAHVKAGLERLERETAVFDAPNNGSCNYVTSAALQLNICMSYGSRGELVQACRQVALDCIAGHLRPDQITEQVVSQHLLTKHCPAEPDLILRTSGEMRLSNFLLWQAAYSEFFFVPQHWPALQHQDFVQILRDYAQGRQRRFGT